MGFCWQQFYMLDWYIVTLEEDVHCVLRVYSNMSCNPNSCSPAKCTEH